MTDFYAFAKKIANVDVDNTARQAVLNGEADINKRVRSQLVQGQDEKGQKIKPLYKSLPYAKRKNRKNSTPGFGVPDLLGETGKLHKGIGISIQNNIVITTSSDEKMKFKSIQQYGGGVFGMQPKNQKENRKINDIEFLRLIGKQTGLI